MTKEKREALHRWKEEVIYRVTGIKVKLTDKEEKK